MPADGGEPRALEHEFEVAVDYVLGVYGRALAHREHEVRILAIGRSYLLTRKGAALASTPCKVALKDHKVLVGQEVRTNRSVEVEGVP